MRLGSNTLYSTGIKYDKNCETLFEKETESLMRNFPNRLLTQQHPPSNCRTMTGKTGFKPPSRNDIGPSRKSGYEKKRTNPSGLGRAS